MNDPHVVALLYQIEHGRWVDYGEAKPIDHEETGFRVEIANEQVCFEFKEHYETKDAAREAIEDYIRVWEFDASLREGPNHFKLKFKRAHIEDPEADTGCDGYIREHHEWGTEGKRDGYRFKTLSFATIIGTQAHPRCADHV